MKHGPLIFLGVLSAVLASWLGAVVAPHFQIGNQGLVTLENLGIDYPLDRLGEAKQGAQAYRAQGCNYCHTQQVLQQRLLSIVTLADPGTNAAAVTDALLKVRRDLDTDDVASLLAAAPQVLLASAGPLQVQEATRLLTNAGARVEGTVANLDADIRRGWGTRRTVSRDYLRDHPVLPGQVRFGPDLANIGARQTNRTLLLRKLYNARIDMPGSTMPRYPYLFEERQLRAGEGSSSNALALPAGFAPAPGIEIVPKPEALQLVAYLQSLRSDQQFYEVFPPQPDTNVTATAGTATNAPPAGTNVTPAATATNAPRAGTNVAPPAATTNAPARP